jgi:hypothetical protein
MYQSQMTGWGCETGGGKQGGDKVTLDFGTTVQIIIGCPHLKPYNPLAGVDAERT